MARRVGDHLDGLQSSELRQFLNHLLGSDPGSPVQGQFWHHTPTDTWRFRGASTTKVLGSLDQITLAAADVNLNSHKITNVTSGSASGDAVNYGQLQDAIAGLSWKDSVRAASTANGTLASAFENGDTVDGVTLATGDRILLKDQTAGAENGIYTVNASGAPTRATDADSATDIRGAAVYVEEGTANAGVSYVLSTDPPITLNTTALVFVQFASSTTYSAGGGIGLSGTTFSVAAGTGLDQDADGLSLEIPVAVSSGGTGATDADAARTNLVALTRYAATIGDNTNATITVTHSLNTLDLIGVEVWDISSGEKEDVGWDKTGVNAVDVSFSYIPGTNTKRVVIGALKA